MNQDSKPAPLVQIANAIIFLALCVLFHGCALCIYGGK